MGLVLRKPFRLLAALLLLIVAAEIIGIMNVPDYDAEWAEARAAYETALAENRTLKKAALAGAAGW